MSLRDQIQQDLIAAMKARETEKLGVLRMLKSAIGAFEVSGKTKIDATADDVLAIVQREAKKRKESIRQFEEGGREDLAAAERAELEIIEHYLPEMLGEDEVRVVVTEVIANMGASGPSDMGKVMGAAMGRLKGQADGGLVREVVMTLLKEV